MRETTDVRLLPCPFCDARLEKTALKGGRDNVLFCHPETEPRCAAQSIAIWSGDEERVTAWSRRAALEPAPKHTAARPIEAGSVGLVAELQHASYTEPEPTRSSLHLKAAAAIAERDERLSTARMIAEAAEDQRDAAKARAAVHQEGESDD